MASSPIEHVVVGKRYKHAPHDAFMFDTIVEDRHDWLVLAPGELTPHVAEAHRPHRIVLRPWLDARITALEIRIENIGRGGGACLTVLGYSTEEELPPDVRKPIKYRMGQVFGAQLRDWVDWY